MKKEQLILSIISVRMLILVLTAGIFTNALISIGKDASLALSPLSFQRKLLRKIMPNYHLKYSSINLLLITSCITLLSVILATRKSLKHASLNALVEWPITSLVLFQPYVLPEVLIFCNALVSQPPNEDVGVFSMLTFVGPAG